eukprot:125518-Lingulodinium_polyedra.AAC.1
MEPEGDDPLSHEGRVALPTRGDGAQFVKRSVTMEIALLDRAKNASDGSEAVWFRDNHSRYDCAQAANGQ